MMKYLLALVLFSLAIITGTSAVRAQLPTTTRSPGPPVSPYLNLLRRGTDPAINYYDLVRPQIDFRNSILGLQSQLTTQQQTVSNLETVVTAPVTGHASRFLNTGTYFMRLGSQNSAAPGVPTAASARPSPAATAAPRR